MNQRRIFGVTLGLLFAGAMLLPDFPVRAQGGQPFVQFSQNPYYAGTMGGSVTITVTLSASSASTVTVAYSTTDQTAKAGVDYTATSGNLVFAPGQTSQTFQVAIMPQPVPSSPPKGFQVSLATPINATLGSPNPAGVVLANNPTPPTVQFSSSTYSANESAGSATITVTLSVASAQTVTVNYATSGGTAVPGKDYVPAAGTLTFSGGSTSQTFQVQFNNNGLPGSSTTVGLSLSNPNGATLGSPSSATLTIVDDNPPVPTVQFDFTDYWAYASDGTATITVSLSNPFSLPVTVNYATSDGSAMAPVDYLPANGTLTFAPGDVSASFQVALVDSGVAGPDKTVNLTLSTPTNATLGNQNTAVLTIVNDNSPPPPPPTVQFDVPEYIVNESEGTATISVSLSAPSTQPITVNYSTSDGTATNPDDYLSTSGTLTFAPGQITQTFQVIIVPDTVVEPDETINLTLTNPTNASLGAQATSVLTIMDDDPPPPPPPGPAPTVEFDLSSYSVNESDGSVAIAVSLSNSYYLPVTVQYQTSDGSAMAPTDYLPAVGFLTFPPGTTSLAFEVSVVQNNTPGANKTVNLSLSNPVNASLGTPPTAVLTIVNDNPPLPTVQFDSPSYTVNEHDGTATIFVTLSAPSTQQVAVTYGTSDGSATSPDDYIPAEGVLTFAPGEVVKNFQVTIVPDTVTEQNESLNLALSNPVGATLGAGTSTLTILDDDVPPTVQFTSATYTVSGDEAYATISVSVTPGSNQTVTVNYMTSDGTAKAPINYEPAAGTLVFQPNSGAGSLSSDPMVQSFLVVLTSSAANQMDSTINLSLSNPVNATLGLNSAVLQVKAAADNRDNQKQIDLAIYHGQDGKVVPDALENTMGATTVANLNDTDGNGVPDYKDTFVKRAETTLTGAAVKGATTVSVNDATYYKTGDQIALSDAKGAFGEAATISAIAGKTLTLAAGLGNAYAIGDKVYHPGRDEIDLMKIVLQKPNPDNGGNVTLSSVGANTNVRVWKNSWKETEVVLPATFATNQLPMTLYVEATAASTALRDISLKLEYNKKWDVVNATAAWVTKTARSPWCIRQAKDGFPNNPVPGPRKDLPNLTNPLLLKSIDYFRAQDGSRYGHGTMATDGTEDIYYGGRILFEFQVQPPGVEGLGVVFDVTRQIHGQSYVIQSPKGALSPFFAKRFPWLQSPPQDNEAPNDDNHSNDEQNKPEKGLLYSADAPFIGMYTETVDFMIYRNTWKEWVRVRLEGKPIVDAPPAKGQLNSLVQGSRASDLNDWHTLVYLRNKGPKVFELVEDNSTTSVSSPIEAKGNKGNGKASATLNGTIPKGFVSEGYFAKYNLVKGWTLAGSSGGPPMTVGGKSPWTLTVPNKVKLVINQGTIPFASGDQLFFSLFTSSAKKNETAAGFFDATAPP
jgi:hypothetical protein